MDDKIPILNVTIYKVVSEDCQDCETIESREIIGTETRIKNDVKLNSMMQNNKS